MADETVLDKITGWINAWKSPSPSTYKPNLDKGINYPTEQEVADVRKGEIYPDAFSAKYNETDDEYLRGSKVRHTPETAYLTSGEVASIPAVSSTGIKPTRRIEEQMARALGTTASTRLHQAKIASAVNPVSAAGFDTNKVVFHSGPPLNVAGVYYPEKDVIVSDPNSETNLTHEFTHRGLLKLAENGSKLMKDIEKNDRLNELATRGIMHGLFNGIEAEVSKQKNGGVLLPIISDAIRHWSKKGIVYDEWNSVLKEADAERKKKK